MFLYQAVLLLSVVVARYAKVRARQITTDNTADTPENDNSINDIDMTNDESFPELKQGIKLPKNYSGWQMANDYFKCALQFNDPITMQDVNSKIKLLNDVIYNYFADNFGHNETVPDKSMVAKYKDYTVKELKKALQNLKSNKGDLSEIKYVSRTLRDKLRNNNNDGLTSDSNESFNHDNYIGRNFWGYIKNVINKKDSILPSFNVTDCFTYFTKSLAKINPNRLFNIPSWIPKLSDPEVQFNLDDLPTNY